MKLHSIIKNKDKSAISPVFEDVTAVLLCIGGIG
ncbi:MAG: hypothetical protein K0S18_606 [Anaerocolumna sp.]|jgi:hypothetical protein|nr:hypothetical protein [Clostridia bacterium]MDF2951023.1 hypothetical protein [Anaerocolumna sp.]